jgi:hypothetical protein
MQIADKAEGKADVFVIVSTYRAKIGEEDAIIALHEDWQRNQSQKSSGYFAWAVLQSNNEPRDFITIAYFSSKEIAQATLDDLKQDVWYFRLVSLLEVKPVATSCTQVWHMTDTINTDHRIHETWEAVIHK